MASTTHLSVLFSPTTPTAVPPGLNLSPQGVCRARAGARCFARLRGGCFFFVVSMVAIVLFFGWTRSSTALNKVA